MSTYEFGDHIVYEAVVYGHLENGPPITVPFPDWWPLRDQVYDAARNVIPYQPNVDFHIIHRFAGDGSIGRTRWTVEAEMHGPTLQWHEDTSGDSQIAFRLIQRTDRQQYRDDLFNPAPWVGLRDLLPAVLGRQALGASPIEITLDGHGVMEFTPQEIMYSRDGLNDVRDPYSSPVYGWTYFAEESAGAEPALWIVPAGQTTGVKLSVCVDSLGNTWSDLSEPAPEFAPLPEPPDQSP